MVFRVSRPGLDDSIATDTLIEVVGGIEERASAPFGAWYPNRCAGNEYPIHEYVKKVVKHQGERFVITKGRWGYNMQGGVSYSFECLSDSARGPMFSLYRQSEGITQTSNSTTLTLRSLNGKSMDVDALRALFSEAP